MKKKTKDLVDFGNFLLSDERKKSKLSHPTFTDEQKKESLKQVSHADLCNWKDRIK